MGTLSSSQTNLHIALLVRNTNKSGAEGSLSSIFLFFNTGKSKDHAKEKAFAISIPNSLQRQSDFLALMERGALAFVQPIELDP